MSQVTRGKHPSLRARLWAIVHQRCPRCLRGRVFRPGNWLQLRMYYACPECRLVYGRESGYFTGAMIVSYILAVPLLALLTVAVALLTGWRFDVVLLVAGLYFLPFVPMLFRYSRVIWMHFDRMVDPNPESERYLPPRATPSSEAPGARQRAATNPDPRPENGHSRNGWR